MGPRLALESPIPQEGPRGQNKCSVTISLQENFNSSRTFSCITVYFNIKFKYTVLSNCVEFYHWPGVLKLKTMESNRIWPVYLILKSSLIGWTTSSAYSSTATRSNQWHKGLVEEPESFSNWRSIGIIYQSASATMIEFLPLPVKSNPG